jgi:diadenosine tetraphosphate (Ap4A) HIT family hydrolase
MNNSCIFCSIISGVFSTEYIAENDDIIVIHDINPKAPIHLLIITKKHVSNIQAFSLEDEILAGKILMMARELSYARGAEKPEEFRLVFNSGKSMGQCVFHIHAHYLVGETMFGWTH